MTSSCHLADVELNILNALISEPAYMHPPNSFTEDCEDRLQKSEYCNGGHGRTGSERLERVEVAEASSHLLQIGDDAQTQGILKTFGRTVKHLYVAIIGKLHYQQTRQAPPETQHVSDAPVDSATNGAIHSVVAPAWPALDMFVDRDGNITSYAQKLLDFAIIGFGKCGTTAVLDWLKRNEQTQCVEAEVWDMVLGHPEALVRKLHELKPGFQYKRGYKSPREIVDSRVLRYYRTYFPETKLMVGIRHPIRWFESLYNFRVQNLDVKETSKMRHPNSLVGVCTRGMKNTCTEKGNFALHLLKLGKQNGGARPGTKTATTLRAERVLGLYKRKWYNASAVPAMPNPVFLFDVDQLSDGNATRSRQFREDVQRFLGLDSDLPPLLSIKPGKVWGPVVQAKKDRYRINICEDEYKPVRANLMRMSRLNADWIRNEFLNYRGVHFSSREFLEKILDGWMVDPCTQAN